MTKKLTIKAWRVNSNMTQEDVADVLGVSRHRVMRWESEGYKPDGLVIYALAKLYKTEVDYIKI